MKEHDACEILGLPLDADVSEIKRKHRLLAKKWHPDVNDSKLAKERFKEVDEAYKTLINLKKKAVKEGKVRPKVSLFKKKKKASKDDMDLDDFGKDNETSGIVDSRLFSHHLQKGRWENDDEENMLADPKHDYVNQILRLFLIIGIVAMAGLFLRFIFMDLFYKIDLPSENVMITVGFAVVAGIYFLTSKKK